MEEARWTLKEAIEAAVDNDPRRALLDAQGTLWMPAAWMRAWPIREDPGFAVKLYVIEAHHERTDERIAFIHDVEKHLYDPPFLTVIDLLWLDSFRSWLDSKPQGTSFGVRKTARSGASLGDQYEPTPLDAYCLDKIRDTIVLPDECRPKWLWACDRLLDILDQGGVLRVTREAMLAMIQFLFDLMGEDDRDEWYE